MIEIPAIKEIHIWSGCLANTTKNLDQKFFCLDSQERQRAISYRFAHDKVKFICGRYMLKSAIAGYLKKNTSEIRFKYNNYGKPELANNETGLYFNISHSGNLILMAFARYMEIGIDLELNTQEDISLLINQKIFTDNEISYFNNLADQEERELFYKLWTSKEAYLKALGTGLSIAPNSIEIIITEDEKIQLALSKQKQNNYYLAKLLNIADQYIGALAAPERPNCLRYFSA